MGMRSATDAPSLLWLAAASSPCAAVNLSDLAGGQTYQKSNAIAIIGIEFVVAVALAVVAAGIVRLRPWSRTPAVMTQIFAIIIGIVLIQAHRFGWGFPALVFAAAGLAGLFAPTSLRKLNHPRGATPP